LFVDRLFRAAKTAQQNPVPRLGQSSFQSCTLGQHLYLCQVDKKAKQRTVIFYKTYFEEFFVEQREKVKAKIIWTFDLIEELQ
jgi:hypothetical protein